MKKLIILSIGLLLMASCKKECSTKGALELTVTKEQNYKVLTQLDGKEYEPMYEVASKNRVVTTHELPFGNYQFLFIGTDGRALGYIPVTINECKEEYMW